MDLTKERALRVPFAAGAHLGADAGPDALVDVSGRGLRLNSTRWTGDPLDSGTDIFQSLLTQIEAECGPWNIAARHLVKRYFEWVEASVEAQGATLEARLAPYCGLFSYRDFRFSAPRPLPRAHLWPEDGGSSELVDVAFFPGQGRCVAFLGRGDVSPRREADRRARLAAFGVKLFEMSEHNAFSPALVPDEPFWNQDVLPCGPLRPMVTI